MVPPVNPEVVEEVETAARRGSSKDPELAAAQKIVVALEELDPEQQARVLAYIQSRVYSALERARLANAELRNALSDKAALRGSDRLRGAEAVIDRQPLAAIAPSSF